MRRMVREDIPALKALWKQTFGDDDSYINLFFEDLHRPDGGLVICAEGVLAAMGFLVPIGEYNGRACCMTYAVACDRRFRGKGYGSRISRQLAADAGEEAVICPAEEGLFDFYREKAGYKTEFFVNEFKINSDAAANAELEPITAIEYTELRERHLLSVPHIALNEKVISHQERICALSGGGLFAIDDGCCAVEAWENQAIVKELLASDRDKALKLLAGAFKNSEITVRCPAENNETSRPFAMAKAGCGGIAPLPWFGFAFD